MSLVENPRNGWDPQKLGGIARNEDGGRDILPENGPMPKVGRLQEWWEW